MNRRAVFLDLNGTLVLPLKPERLDDLVAIPGAAHAVARLVAAGFACPVVTVQSRIAKGYFSAADFRHWFEAFARSWSLDGARIDGPYVCPHRFTEPCPCKKPNTLLYEAAARHLPVDPSRSYVIGDSADDIEAAARLGAASCLVRTGWGADPEVPAKAPPDVTVDSIVEAVDWVLAAKQTSSPLGFPAPE
jgi:D-glycero-D-manno-heptose 1,7-bisphosphate phosphatase